MKINPFEIGKMVNKAIKHKDRYEAKVEELKSNPLTVTSGTAAAVFDVETNRISQLRVDGVDEETLKDILKVVNDIHDKAENFWNIDL